MKDGNEDSGPQRRRAVALRYGGVESTPEVVAKGEGDLADRILAAAREAGIPIEEDPDLVELLAACEIGEEVPVELWTAVAEILVHLWRLNEELDPR
ncbi:MAG: EscU/YscU/HrcU family type III secretion system export apparatus switch protein [Planctomycetota bacterium]|jgi:flagellar biosynthesis protein